jgi:hypothetical protein
MALPNSVIAGVNKSGTTSLFHALAQQEGIHPSNVKETHFFDPLKYGEPLPPLDQYQQLFPAAPSGATVLEATPGYFYGGKDLATALASLLPSVRIAIVLREPAARAFSWWRFCRSRLLVDPDQSFADYLVRCEELGSTVEKSRDLVAWRGLSGGHYSEYLPSWQEVFGDRLMVLFHDDLRQDFDETTRRVARHFRADMATPTSTRLDNVTTDVSNRALQSLALRVNRAGERVWRAAPGLKKVARGVYYSLNARQGQQTLSDRDRAWLRDYYAEERTRLRKLVDPERMPPWLKASS